MKHLFLIAGIFSVGASFAQDFNITQNWLKKLKSKSMVSNPLLVNPMMPSDRYVVLPKSGTTIYVLPQDNMPCIVPDMTQFNMPNRANAPDFYFYPHSIPNPALVDSVKPALPLQTPKKRNK